MNDPISYTPDEIKWADALRNLKPGDPAIVRPDSEYVTANGTRNRETAATGAKFNIRRDKPTKQIFVICTERPLVYNYHGVTINAKYHGRNAKPSDEDDIHSLFVYTGRERIFLHKTDGSFKRTYEGPEPFKEFLSEWTIM